MQLKINNLSKKFGKKVILSDANFTFEKGKIYVLLGRNGAGKTTLFNCINGDIDHNNGTITLEDKNSSHTVTYEDISYVPSTPVVPNFLTGLEFVRFFLSVNSQKQNLHKSPEEYLRLVGIKDEDMNTLLRDYSHGMKTKIQLLISLLANTDILLLDEPLTALDVVAAEEMKELLKRNKDEKITIFSTHILDLAMTLADEIVLLHNKSLSSLDSNMLTSSELKQNILDILREDETVDQ